MTIRRIATSLLVAMLTILFSFIVSAAPYSETGNISDCIHPHKSTLMSEGYSYVDSITHEWHGLYYLECKICGELGYTTMTHNESHSYNAVNSEHYHEGVLHYYTYTHACRCGDTYVESYHEYCGNPCGKIHLSVPDENI